MFIDKNSITLYNNDKTKSLNVGQYLVEARFSYNKLWAADSGRNLSGKQTGSLLGIFPKITLQFRKLTKTELEAVVPYLDYAHQNIKYYDPRKKAYITMQTYTGDYEIINKNIINSAKKNEGFSVSFIAVSKRG